MAKVDRDLTVINSMTEEQFKNQINSDGKAPALINQLVMTEDETGSESGKPIGLSSVVNTVLSTGFQTIDISTFIPDYDSSGYYEIYSNIYMSGASHSTTWYSDVLTKQTSVYKTNSSGDWNTLITPIPAKRYIYAKSSTTSSAYAQFTIYGYRRVY